MKVGERFKSTQTNAEVIVVKAGTDGAQLYCAGAPMAVVGTGAVVPAAGTNTSAGGEPLVIGKRYSAAGVEVLCVTPGEGPLSVDGVQLELTAPRTLPSSD